MVSGTDQYSNAKILSADDSLLVDAYCVEAMSGMSGVAQRQVSDRIRTLGSATENTLESNELRAAVRYVR